MHYGLAGLLGNWVLCPPPYLRLGLWELGNYLISRPGLSGGKSVVDLGDRTTMFQESSLDANASVIVVPSELKLPEPGPQFMSVRHLIFGPLRGLNETTKHLHKLRYANFKDWSQPQPTGETGEFVTVLIKKLRLG